MWGAEGRGEIPYINVWLESYYDPPEGHPGQHAYTFLIRILSTSLSSVSIFSVCCSSSVSISMAETWATPPLPPHLGSNTKALLVMQPRLPTSLCNPLFRLWRCEPTSGRPSPPNWSSRSYIIKKLHSCIIHAIYTYTLNIIVYYQHYSLALNCKPVSTFKLQNDLRFSGGRCTHHFLFTL